jgi:uncharacterized protein (TIGR03083 family)
MATSSVGDMDALRNVVEVFQADCESLTDSDWTRTTPCPDWDLESLVDHVVGGNRFTVAILSGATTSDALRMAVESFGDRATGSAEAISSMWELDEAFREPDALTRSCHHIERDLTGQQVLRLRLHDLIVRVFSRLSDDWVNVSGWIQRA